MPDHFPKEQYKKACDMLTPSTAFTKEAICMIKPKKRSHFKSRTFVAFASVLILLFSVSIVSVAATNGEILKGVAYFLDELVLDTKNSTPKEKVYHTEDGTNIHVVDGYGDNGEYYVTLISMEDSGRLHLKIGEVEKDITDELNEKGIYTEEYTYNGLDMKLTVTGDSENPILSTELIINELN
ncbi:hypothetical protein [Lachnoclostridium sp. An181]|uniref:hypothetical protein n=1 Tax=Lachnoclostridium sp. An181 TaxID=1965575 RepID=UPI000B37F73E|nr:hypothetical protein [Lachnoclostridium sp. An181]OUP48281.1 hypothetical protein B5F18_11775 [Lachnoclostridium sp. An181]